jgi:hypothetical protein
MIARLHEFNTEWWGENVGIVDIGNLSKINDQQVITELSPYHWVEARTNDSNSVDLERMRSLGFFQVDTQVHFRIRLSAIEYSSSLKGLDVAFADEQPFKIVYDDILDFSADRFARLPGCTPEKNKQRYSLWSEHLMKSQPENTLCVLKDGEIQGYYLSQKNESGFQLTLAMLSTDSQITGMHLYHRALLAYKERGIRIGGASFSVNNLPVLNIYANLGARFISTERFWFRMS